MGTRALTFVYESTEEPLVCMYSQWDGYPSDHGLELADFINSRKLVNGLTLDNKGVANGMPCLAALMVSKFKGSEAGGFYLFPTSMKDVGQQFEYHIFEDKVIVKDHKQEKLFEGDWKSFLDYCDNYE